jgi:signal transduction histidine kinase
MTARPKTLIVGTACGAAVLTLLITVLPFVEFAYRSEAMHAAVESAATVIASLAAILVAGRFRRGAALRDVLLAGALALLAVSNLVFWAIPTFDNGPTTRVQIWAPLWARALSVCVLVAAAFAPTRRIARPSRAIVLMLAGVPAAVAGVALLAALVGPHLDPGIDLALSPAASNRPRIVGSATLLGLQLGLMLLYFAAAAGFARRAGRDELMLWFAAAAVLAGFARLNYFLFPSIYSEWVYTGDALRFGSYALLFIGAVREIAAYQRDLARVAVADERRRMARNLHDGVAQDLAYISREGRRLGAQGVESAALKRISDAADRALDLSRDAIAALTGRADEPLAVAIARAAEEVAGRAGATVRMQLAPEVKVPGPARDDLVRIVREAVTNATRHGGARRLTINLDERSDGITLTVGDDGSGFEPARLNGRSGFGLISMRERAEQLGGEFSVVSYPGGGTVVTVRLP